MPEQVLEALAAVARVLEIVGASALILGFVVATVTCIRQSLGEGPKPAIKRYRRKLGRTILIGLEILVAATIIKTITLEPTFEGIGFLAIMVAIRTTLGWTTGLELTGRWPWQKSVPNEAKARMPL